MWDLTKVFPANTVNEVVISQLVKGIEGRFECAVLPVFFFIIIVIIFYIFPVQLRSLGKQAS